MGIFKPFPSEPGQVEVLPKPTTRDDGEVCVFVRVWTFLKKVEHKKTKHMCVFA